jgi:hypothetical protein
MRFVSRRTICVAALILGVAILHREVLFAGQVYHQEDAADGYYPSHVAILRALGQGELPTWEPGSWCGWPLSVDPYYGLFYPPSLLYAVVGAVRGTGLTIALHALAAGLGMLWLLRRRKLEWGPALVGAVSLAFGSFMVERIRHIIFAQMLAWLPLILVGVEGYLTSRRARELILAAVATGMALICGALPLAPYVMMLVAAYVLPRLLSRAEPVADPVRATLWLVAAALIGGAIAAAQIVPTVAHLPYSPRSLGVDYAFASTYAWPDWRYLAVLIAPDAFGTSERGHWFGAFNHWEMAGWYAGLLTVALAPLSLGRRRGELTALFVVTLMAIALAFGDHGPLHPFFFRHVPLYGALRCPTRALVMAIFALPILAAEGLSWLTQKALKQPIAIVLALLLLGTTLAIAWILHHGRSAPEPETVARLAFAHMTLVLGIGGAALLIALGRVVPWRLATVFVALVSLVDLLTISRGYVQPKPGDWAAGTERFTAVDWLLAQHHPGATMDRFVIDYRGPFRLHNLGMTYDLESANGYESFTVWRYVNLLYTINNGAPYPYEKLKQDLAAGDIRRFDSPLVDLLNVRWFIGTAPPTADWLERFRPPPGAPPHAVHEPQWDPQLGVYENPHVLPRAFVVHHATVLPDDKAALRALPALDPQKDVIVDAAPVFAPAPAPSFEPAKLVAHARKELVIETDATAAGILVVSDAWYPGWRATLDGQPAPLLRADYALRGVAVPAGHHTVTMHFASMPTRHGLAVSLAGLLALVVLGFIGRRHPSVL